MIDFFDFGKTDRYSIPTLIKLCLHKETANDAFKLLYNTANRENILQNSAKIAFIDLYQVRLAETCLNLEERFNIINELEEDNGISEIIIKGLERALKANNFVGHIQSGELKNRDKIFKPIDKSQLDLYFSAVIEKLKSIALNAGEPFSQLAIDSLVFRMSEQLTFGCFDQMLDSIKEIIDKEGRLPDEIRQKLTEFNSDRYQFSKHKLDKIRGILKEYKPKTVEEELMAFVVKAPWLRERDEHNNYINVSAEKAKELALKFINENILLLFSNTKLLLEGEQRQTFPFAEVLGNKNTIEYNKKVLDSIIHFYDLIPVEEQNSVFVSGLIFGAKNDEFTRFAIDKLILSNITEVHGIRLVRYLNPITYEDLLNIKEILIANPDYLRNLEYLDLTNLTNEEIMELVGWIKDVNYSFALEILYEILKKDNDRWNDLKGIINELLYVDEITEYSSFINSTFHIEDLISKSINDDNSIEHIQFLTHQIIEKLNIFSFKNESLLEHLTYFLINDHWENSWPLFARCLITDFNANYKLRMTLENITFNNELLFNWAKCEPKLYASVAMPFMNIFKKNDEGNLEWDPYAKLLIDEFGNEQKVLDNIRSKFTNYFMVSSASASGLYKKRKVLVDELLDHKFDNVKEFAKNMSEYLSSRIVDEDKFGENYELNS
jgi:hypothetical protein